MNNFLIRLKVFRTSFISLLHHISSFCIEYFLMLNITTKCIHMRFFFNKCNNYIKFNLITDLDLFVIRFQ